LCEGKGENQERKILKDGVKEKRRNGNSYKGKLRR
jgi:hypothetical protein